MARPDVVNCPAGAWTLLTENEDWSAFVCEVRSGEGELFVTATGVDAAAADAGKGLYLRQGRGIGPGDDVRDYFPSISSPVRVWFRPFGQMAAGVWRDHDGTA